MLSITLKANPQTDHRPVFLFTLYVGQEFKEKSGTMTLNAISRAEFFTILQSFFKK